MSNQTPPTSVLALPKTKVELIEVLAAIEHERWSKWQRYLHDKCGKQEDGSIVIPAELVSRWERQIETPYAELSDMEKSSDRNEVHGYWFLVRAFFESRGADPSLE